MGHFNKMISLGLLALCVSASSQDETSLLQVTQNLVLSKDLEVLSSDRELAQSQAEEIAALKAQVVALSNRVGELDGKAIEDDAMAVESDEEILTNDLPRLRGPDKDGPAALIVGPDKGCGDMLANAEVDMCFVSGGFNPAITNHQDQFNERAWQNIFGSLPAKKCFFCGVNGKYEANNEGTVMLSCGEKGWPDLLTVCLSKGKELQQDTILARFGGDARLLVTTPREGGSEKFGDTYIIECSNKRLPKPKQQYKAIFNPVPEKYKGGPLSSIVGKGEQVVFTGKEPTDCWK